MDQVLMLARQMRPALLAGDWKRAFAHAREAENILRRLREALVEPEAALHVKVRGWRQFHDHLRFVRGIQKLRARSHPHVLTHQDALDWSAKNPEMPQVSERLANEWVSEVLGKRKASRPPKKK